MASTNVIVLTPNGRRQNVKVTPNTTILQILEDVCKKHGFKADEYDIKHHNHVLDASSILRFSGLPNNAQLEMCPIQKARKEAPIQLLIQLEDGSRLSGTFTSGTSLWDVMNTLCPEQIKIEEHPVVIYMRQEVYGLENLTKTTLKSLGLTGGRAMMRLIHKKPEDLQKQAAVVQIIPPKPPSEEKPYFRRPQMSEPKKLECSEPSTSKIEPRDSPPSKKNYLSELIKAEKSKKAEKRKSPPKQIEPMEVDDNTPGSSKPEPAEEDFVFLGERNALAFSLDMSTTVPHEDLPDEFFELTIHDARKILQDLKQNVIELEERPLLTATYKSLEEEKRKLRQLNQYKKSVIRVQFPDRTVLQGTFKPSETIETVKNFVRGYLEDTTSGFHLYTTPPKKILDPELNLLDTNCIPSAVVHFSFDANVDPSTKYLKSDLFSKFTSHSIASLAATKSRNKQMNKEKPDINPVEADMASTSNDAASGSEADRPENSGTNDPGNVPKWFKLK